MTLESILAAARVRNAHTTPKHDGSGLYEPTHTLLAKHLGQKFQPLRWPTVHQAQLQLLQAIALQAAEEAKLQAKCT